MGEKYLEVIRQVIKDKNIQLCDKADIDSILFVSIVVELEKESGKEIGLEDLCGDSYDTYADIVKAFED